MRRFLVAVIGILFMNACSVDAPDNLLSTGPSTEAPSESPRRSENTRRSQPPPPPSQERTYEWIYLIGRELTAKDVEIPYRTVFVDLFDTSRAIIQALKKNGKKVICYFSAGTLENWRPDAPEFPREAIGNPLENWEGEYWIDVRNSKVKEIMARRIQLAKEKGCDGIDPDNTDFYLYDTGFPLTERDAINYYKFISRTARELGLKVGLKNSGKILKDVLEDFDFVVSENCFKYQECGLYTQAIPYGKEVYDVEYELSPEEFCPQARRIKVKAAKACYSLDGCWEPCEKFYEARGF